MKIQISGIASISNPAQKEIVEQAVTSLGRLGADAKCRFAEETGSAMIQVDGDSSELPSDWQRALTKVATFADTCTLVYRREDDPTYRLTIKKDRFLDMPEMTETCPGYEWHDPFH